MTQKDQVQELRELIAATKNHFAYIQELGVENIAIPTALAEGLRQPSTANLTTGSYSEAVKNSRPTQHETYLRAAASELPSDVLFGDFAPVAPRLAKSNETFEEIWTNIGDCTRCPLYQGRTHIVHTEGNRKARLMFVGEAPGADEDAQARPFVGRAGQLLTKIIEAIGLKREEVLIGNVNRCRPPANRPPTPEEASMCKPFLLREVALVQPEVIVVMGNTAMRNLLETKDGITKLRGRF